ncbi:MAG: hypothetical protein Kow0040_24540 [Thermogutta sp.]
MRSCIASHNFGSHRRKPVVLAHDGALNYRARNHGAILHLQLTLEAHVWLEAHVRLGIATPILEPPA